MSDYYGEANEAESIATVHRAINLGVNFFYTAEAYGPYANEGAVPELDGWPRRQLRWLRQPGVLMLLCIAIQPASRAHSGELYPRDYFHAISTHMLFMKDVMIDYLPKKVLLAVYRRGEFNRFGRSTAWIDNFVRQMPLPAAKIGEPPRFLSRKIPCDLLKHTSTFPSIVGVNNNFDLRGVPNISNCGENMGSFDLPNGAVIALHSEISNNNQTISKQYEETIGYFCVFANWRHYTFVFFLKTAIAFMLGGISCFISDNGLLHSIGGVAMLIGAVIAVHGPIIGKICGLTPW